MPLPGYVWISASTSFRSSDLPPSCPPRGHATASPPPGVFFEGLATAACATDALLAQPDPLSQFLDATSNRCAAQASDLGQLPDTTMAASQRQQPHQKTPPALVHHAQDTVDRFVVPSHCPLRASSAIPTRTLMARV